jgi:hypothetical protein
LLRHLTLKANIIAAGISLGSRRVKKEINFFALFLSGKAGGRKGVLRRGGEKSETFTRRALRSILKLGGIGWRAPW